MIVLNRARHLYSKEYFISDSIKFEFNQMYLLVKGKWRECEQDTRSIHMEDMIDSEGTKIFASLSEDGRGGDNLEILDCESSKYVAVYNKTMFSYGAKNVNPAEDEWYFETFYELDGDIKVTGIQE